MMAQNLAEYSEAEKLKSRLLKIQKSCSDSLDQSKTAIENLIRKRDKEEIVKDNFEFTLKTL